MPPPILLVPPSEGKAEGGRVAGGGGALARPLAAPRAALLDALAVELRAASLPRRQALLGVRGELLERAEEATALILDGRAPVLPAWRRYTGVVWAHLGPGDLSREQLGQLLVPSGLYGMTTGLDPVADYRLKMSVALGPLGKLSSYWRPELTELICRRYRGRALVNLLPAEHAAAVDWERVGGSCELLEVRFLDRDGRAAAGHAAKAVKGVLARALLADGLEAAGGFRHEGWRSRRRGGALELIAP